MTQIDIDGQLLLACFLVFIAVCISINAFMAMHHVVSHSIQ